MTNKYTFTTKDFCAILIWYKLAAREGVFMFRAAAYYAVGRVFLASPALPAALVGGACLVYLAVSVAREILE